MYSSVKVFKVLQYLKVWYNKTILKSSSENNYTGKTPGRKIKRMMSNFYNTLLSINYFSTFGEVLPAIQVTQLFKNFKQSLELIWLDTKVHKTANFRNYPTYESFIS